VTFIYYQDDEEIASQEGVDYCDTLLKTKVRIRLKLRDEL